jgi:hypothetical protein
MSRINAKPTAKPKSWMYKYTSRARKPKVLYTIKFTSTRPKTAKPDELSTPSNRYTHKLNSQSGLTPSPLVPSYNLDQISNPEPQADPSRDQHVSDLIPLSGSAQLPVGSVYQLPSQDYSLDEENTTQAIETFCEPVNKFTSRLTGPVPGNLTALVEYQQDSLVIMRMATREVVRSVESRLGLGRGEVNDEEGIQTWSNGMLALFEMIVKALYCRIRELKYLVHTKGEVVGGIVDGMVVLAPGLLLFDVTDERSDIVEEMVGDAIGIHREKIKFRRVRDRLREVIDQWYEGSTWIDPREDSDADTDGAASHDISEEAIISQEATNDHSRKLLDLPTSIHDSDLSPTQDGVSPIQYFAEVLDIALQRHRLLVHNDNSDAVPFESEVADIWSNEADDQAADEEHKTTDIGPKVQPDANIIWAREEDQSEDDVKHGDLSVYIDNVTELVNSHKWIVWNKGDENDFIGDIEYHENEIWNWEDALEMQRELELDEILFWESDEGRELKADLELDEILFWDSEEGRELKADMEMDEYLMSISEEAMEFEREFELERLVAEEAAFGEKEARLECMGGAKSS